MPHRVNNSKKPKEFGTYDVNGEKDDRMYRSTTAVDNGAYDARL